MQITDDVGVRFYVHKRDCNKKRNFVLVNRDLAKHYPCVAADTFNMCRKLAEKGCAGTKWHGDVMVVAFAETATALGIIAAGRLKELNPESNIFLITTTREFLGKETSVVEFQEKHSHAVNQILYFGEEIKKKFDNCTRLVIIDDELSTGNTVLNLLDGIEKQCGVNTFTSVEVWSLLNGMSDDNRQVYKSRGINLVWLEEINKPEIEKHTETLGDSVMIATAGSNKPKIEVKNIELTSGDVRYGVNILEYTKELESKLEKVSNGIKCDKYNAVDVLGTEECMYPAIVMAGLLGSRFPSLKVTCHSTTRSPIVASNATLLTSRTSLSSLYDRKRNTYLYNMAEKCKNTLAVVVTDAVSGDEEKEEFAAALGNNVSRVEFIYIKTKRIGK